MTTHGSTAPRRTCFLCYSDHHALHTFPNPEKKLDIFKKWAAVLGDKISTSDPNYVFRNYRLCHKHFEENFCVSTVQLRRNAVPSLFLEDITKQGVSYTEQIRGKTSTSPAYENSAVKLEKYLKKRYKQKNSKNATEFDLIEMQTTVEWDVPVESTFEVESILNELNIKNDVISQFCFNLKWYDSYSNSGKADFIDQFYSWLTDSRLLENELTISAHILKLNKMIWPEVANHPLLLRRVLTPKESVTSDGLFEETLFAEHIKPLIVELYKSREIKVRLNLLDVLQSYITVFTKEEIEMILLPEILIGMQDSDKMVVRATLISLAQLVDVLGPTAVIGGQRQDIFVQTEVYQRQCMEEKPTVNRNRMKMEHIDSANESESDQDQLDLLEETRAKKRKKYISSPTAVIGGRRQYTRQRKMHKTQCLEVKRSVICQFDNVDSANDSEAEQDPLDLAEFKRTKPRKKDIDVELKVDESGTKQEIDIIQEDWKSDGEECESETKLSQNLNDKGSAIFEVILNPNNEINQSKYRDKSNVDCVIDGT